jgi:F-type H+-transporting ATPase subunit epsilon
VLSYSVSNQMHYLAVDGGFVEIREDHVRVLADSAVKAEDVNLVKAKSDLQQATDQLGTAPDPDAALAAFNRAQARVNAATSLTSQ